jgi:hypothetical protein
MAEEDKIKQPSIQRESYSKAGEGTGTESRGTPLQKGEPTKRQAAKDEAKQYGIDTKGMSTREIKNAVDYQKETALAAAEINKFVEKATQQFATPKKSEDLNATRTPAAPTRVTTEDRRGGFATPTPSVTRRTQPYDYASKKFPPEGWTTLKITLCKDNAEQTADVLIVDPEVLFELI